MNMISVQEFGEKYAERYYAERNLIRLDEDVAKMFPDAKSVNNALRALAKLITDYQKKAS